MSNVKKLEQNIAEKSHKNEINGDKKRKFNFEKLYNPHINDSDDNSSLNSSFQDLDYIPEPHS